MGRLQQRTWTAEDGSARSTVEVVTEELGRASGGRRPTPIPTGRSVAGRSFAPTRLVEVVAEELGLSLRWATVTTTRTTRSSDR
jgi:hypothetical protein